MKITRGSFDDALKSNRPFMAITQEGKFGHAVVVNGTEVVNGKTYVIIRDPSKGAYRQELDAFKQTLTRDPKVSPFEAYWGVPK